MNIIFGEHFLHYVNKIIDNVFCGLWFLNIDYITKQTQPN